jgi:twitching motility protein PilT
MLILNKGSDLHFTVDEPLRIRINGKLAPLSHEGHYLQATAEHAQRILGSVISPEQRAAFDANKELDFAYQPEGLSYRFRCNYFLAHEQWRAVFREIPTEVRTLDQLAMPDIVRRLCQFPRGLVLVTGPTGSGKSTTLAAMIDEINSHREEHILTIEDPVEFVHRSKKSTLSQRELGVDTRSFANALKAALRQDPDVILVGEMRDPETISLGITAAETGHLVFATLHTQDAAQSIDRLIDAFPPEQQNQVKAQLAMTLQGVISQQLLPRADGDGRVVALEIMTASDAVRNGLREGKTHEIYSYIQMGAQHGMQTMEQSLADLVVRKAISRDIAVERAGKPGELDRAITDLMRRADH